MHKNVRSSLTRIVDICILHESRQSFLNARDEIASEANVMEHNGNGREGEKNLRHCYFVHTQCEERQSPQIRRCVEEKKRQRHDEKHCCLSISLSFTSFNSTHKLRFLS